MTDKTIYASLTREQVQQLCDLYNHIDSMLDDAGETLDIQLSELRQLREKCWELRELFEFKPQRDVDNPDRPMPWKPSVLPDDERAWYYNDDS